MAPLRAAAIASLLAALPTALAGYNANGTDNVSVYWGQNSLNQGTGSLAQQRLSYYCANSAIDIIPLAFMDGISPPMTNFANAGNNCTAFADNANVLNCPQIEADIIECQTTYKKTIMLSLGGATYTQGGWSSTSDAQAAATQVWQMFGPSTTAAVDRPFGTAVVDGFDFDFESTVSNLGPFASELRSLMDAATSKAFYLSAAPQCVYPDAADQGALQGEVYFDFIQIQFYNNFCGVDNYTPGTSTQNAYNFDVWDTWAHTVSKNPDVKILMGIPANTGAGGGYVSGTQLADVIAFTKQYSSFGGVMMWDMSQLYGNSGFLASVTSDLGAAGDPPGTTTAAPTTTTAAAGTTTTAPPATTTTSTGSTGTGGTLPTQWDQCGGEGYTGATQCAAPYTCVEETEYWSSCQ